MIDVMVEVVKGQREKRCLDAHGVLKSLRTASRPYPYSYGYIEGTIDEEGDGLDCWIVSGTAPEPGSTVRCDTIGLLEFFEDDQPDHKILAVPTGEVPPPDMDRLISEIAEYIQSLFAVFPEARIRIGGFLSSDSAMSIIEASRVGFRSIRIG